MLRTQAKKIEKLERSVDRHLRQMKEIQQDPLLEPVRSLSAIIIGNLSVLALYGEPKPDEALNSAWLRAVRSKAWRAYYEEYGGFDEYGRESGTPFDSVGAAAINRYFRRNILPTLPGNGASERLNLILARAPAWFVWFTYGDLHARILGLKVPNLSSGRRVKRASEIPLIALPDRPAISSPSKPASSSRESRPNKEDQKSGEVK